MGKDERYVSGSFKEAETGILQPWIEPFISTRFSFNVNFLL